MTKQTVPAANFVGTLTVNVDNDKMSDAEFREFVRNTLPIVDTSDEWSKAVEACKGEVSGYLNGKTCMGDHYGSYYAQDINGRISKISR